MNQKRRAALWISASRAGWILRGVPKEQNRFRNQSPLNVLQLDPVLATTIASIIRAMAKQGQR